MRLFSRFGLASGMDDAAEATNGVGEAESTPAARRSARWATAAFLLAVTSLLLPWWRLRYTAEGLEGADTTDTRLFAGAEPVAHPWATILTGVLVVVAIGIIFVRLAARSFREEPPMWRRDIVVAAILMALALASTLLWPADIPSFWGGRTYVVENGTGVAVTEAAMPALGWWCAALAMVLAFVAWLFVRQGRAGRPT